VSDDIDLDWLVKGRSKIQILLLRLHNLAKAHDPSAEDARSVVLQLMLGTAFSLWRAVFLVRRKRDRATLHGAAEAFLGLLVQDNIINYSQDKATAAWSGGYYLNNAMFRLRELASRHLADAGVRIPKGIRRIDEFLTMPFEKRLAATQTDLWDMAYDVSAEICDSLEGGRSSGPETETVTPGGGEP